MLDPTERFSDRAENYARFRPDYPAGVIDILRREARLTTDSTVADIGSGTGIFAAQLLPHVHRVYAVEPNAAMRLAAERRFYGDIRFASVAATAEATTLPDQSVDLITAAQAFHWFDRTATRREFGRILRPGARVALLWNEREVDRTPFLVDYEKLLRTRTANYVPVEHREIDVISLTAFFGSSSIEVHTMPNEQRFNLAGLVGRTFSSSAAPRVGEPDYDGFSNALTRLFHAYEVGEEVVFHYQTRLYLGTIG